MNGGSNQSTVVWMGPATIEHFLKCISPKMNHCLPKWLPGTSKTSNTLGEAGKAALSGAVEFLKASSILVSFFGDPRQFL